MKRVLSLVLILSLLAAALCLPAAARSSDYISRSDALIAKSGTNSISIKTTTGSGSSMTSIGVTTIVIEQSANGTSWTPVRTYSSRYTAAMLGHNVMTHTYTQTYTGPVNYSYRALVTFYAADKTAATASRCIVQSSGCKSAAPLLPSGAVFSHYIPEKPAGHAGPEARVFCFSAAFTPLRWNPAAR